jgi:hypothetical protein
MPRTDPRSVVSIMTGVKNNKMETWRNRNELVMRSIKERESPFMVVNSSSPVTFWKGMKQTGPDENWMADALHKRSCRESRGKS